MSLIDQLASVEVWNAFLEEKIAGNHLDKRQLADLSAFIQNQEYLSVVHKMMNKESFYPPLKQTISKQSSSKKRIVYSFAREENYVLKLLTYLLIRKYDHLFAKNLYSFRSNHGVKKAVDYIRGDHNLSDKYVYKVDIRNYFNSVDVSKLLPMLKQIMKDEIDIYAFIERLLTDPRVRTTDGMVVQEEKGIMAGVPISSFLANVYLHQLDWHFFEKGNRYARYSDDIIVFSRDSMEREADRAYIQSYLASMSLSVNLDKESTADPQEPWDFLGVSYQNGIFDISPISLMKLKKKMWRKSRALLRWKNRKHLDNICAAKAFVKSFNIKLYDNPKNTELTWSRWYFPIINTTESLAQLDHYMQECIRYIATGRRTKKRYDFTYQMMKGLGYRSLVNEYYKLKDISRK